VGPQPVANPTAVYGGAPRVIRRELVVGLLLLAGVVSAPDRAVGINTDSYRAAAASGAIGGVTGRIYEESKRPKVPDQPFTGAAVIVLPKSAEIIQKLEDIKRAARNSADDYRAAGPSIMALRRAYEKEIWDSGGVDLVKSTTADADGHFTLTDLPAGDWLLIATHTVKIDKHATVGPPKQRGVYAPKTHLTGYQRVTVWLREVTVENGRSENIDLTDRGAWFSGVVEERAPDASR
jgi:hypothetical protein